MVEKYKARLVIFGNKKIEAEDFTRTFAPIAKLVTDPTVLPVTIAKDWEIHQMECLPPW